MFFLVLRRFVDKHRIWRRTTSTSKRYVNFSVVKNKPDSRYEIYNLNNKSGLWVPPSDLKRKEQCLVTMETN